jgi:hypothetical protein
MTFIRDIAHQPDEEIAAILSWAMPIAESLLKAHGAFASPVFKESLSAAIYRKEHDAINAAWDDYFHKGRGIPAEKTAVPAFRPPVARSITSLFNQYAKAAELRKVRPPEPGIAPNHSFRHWLISECKRSRVDPDFQRQLAGHTTKDDHGRYGPGDVPVLMEALEQVQSPL